MNKKKLIVYTAAWGSYVDVYRKYGKAAMQDDLKRLSKDGYEIQIVEVGFNLETVHTSFLVTYLRQIVAKSAMESAMVFFAVPDVVWAKDSIYNMVKLAEDKHCMCIATPYQRVDKQAFLDNVSPKIFSSKELVDITYKYPHPSFEECFDDKDINCSWAGVAGRKIDDNNSVLIHSMPSVWIAQFHDMDIAFWHTMRCWGEWDRTWLNHLYLTDRVRVVGSSEIAYAIEMTYKDKNVPLYKKGLINNDGMIADAGTRSLEHVLGFRKLMYGITR